VAAVPAPLACDGQGLGVNVTRRAMAPCRQELSEETTDMVGSSVG
jgi:hypothetical protein